MESPEARGAGRTARLAPAFVAGLLVSLALLALVRSDDRLPGGDGAPLSAGPAVLSDERTLSRWAHVRVPVAARARPAPGARVVTRLSTRTSDDTPELVLALSKVRGADGRDWVRARLPMRPNNRTGWVRRSALGPLHRVRTFLRVDRGQLRATLYEDGRRRWQAPVAVGTAANPTPAGSYYVRSRIVPLTRGGPYGAFAFGTNGHSPGLSDWPGGGVVGMHGTDRPELIPGRISHGCVRVRNRDMSRLRRLMPLGTPIEIL